MPNGIHLGSDEISFAVDCHDHFASLQDPHLLIETRRHFDHYLKLVAIGA